MWTISWAPLFQTPLLSSIFTLPLPLDATGLLRPLEMVLFPGSLVSVIEHRSEYIVRVSSPECTSDLFFTDIRFLSRDKPKVVCRLPRPSLEVFLDKLETFPAVSYIWGGNVHRGIPELLDLYPMPQDSVIDEKVSTIWQFKGVDCSGLLYEISEGTTPRNTKELVSWGLAIHIAGKKDEEIAATLLPGDIIVWVGHVLIVGRDNFVYESRAPVGVCRTPLVQRLAEIRKTRMPLDDFRSNPKNSYVVRRWHEDALCL